MPSSWVAVENDVSIAIRWVRDGTDLSGQLQIAQLEDARVASHGVSFTGSIADADILLELDQGLGLSTSWSGTISRNQLALSVPSDDGTLLDLVLIPGDTAAFNDGVAHLQAQAEVAQEELAAQEAIEETERQRDAAQQEAERERREQQQARDNALRDIDYYLETARAQLGQARERLRGSLEGEIATLEHEVANAADDYDIDVSVPYALNVAVAYEREAVHDYLGQARSALAQAREVGPQADSFAAEIEAIAAEADEIEQGTDTRWRQAVAAAARVGVKPDGP